jgi:hypothetical protein
MLCLQLVCKPTASVSPNQRLMEVSGSKNMN